MADAQARLGFVTALRGDLLGAESLCLDALRYAREVDNQRAIAWDCLDLALIHVLQKDYDTALSLCAESLGLRAEGRNSQERVAVGLQLLGAIAVEQHMPDAALRLFGAASVLWETSKAIF